MNATRRAIQSAQGAVEHRGPLLDRYLPAYDVREYHEARVRAEPGDAYAAFRSLDLERSRIVRLLFAIRTLPSRFRRREVPPDTPSASFLDAALAVGWRVLEEVPGREIVVGAVTQPWAPVVRFRGLSGPEFIEFAEPGFTKIAWSITTTPDGSGATRIATETRVEATDSVSRKRFRRYWRVVSPGIRLIRRISLRMIQRELEVSRRAA
jgi:hypothetical protein